MNCHKCGAILISGAQFCGACGARMDASNMQASDLQASNPQAEAGGAGRGIQIDSDARGEGRG